MNSTDHIDESTGIFQDPVTASIFDGTTFLPIDEPSKTDMLLDEVWKHRQATFLALGLKISKEEPRVYRTSFSDFLQMFLNFPPKMRKQITEHPPFRIWLRQSTQALATASIQSASEKEFLKEKLAEFGRVLSGFYDNRDNVNHLRIPGTSIRVQRFVVDPLIAEVSPPSYQFPDESKQREIDENTAYRLPFFVDVATVAVERIKQTWPAAYQDFTKFVRMIIHVPDADFRSCSADRYAGVIFLSADDETLLDIEESLIHEYGHQILYNVAELVSLIRDDMGSKFKLPWSGAERDFWGYFHAFYIYVLLICYFAQVQGRREEEQERATQRLVHILKGALKAIPDFEAVDCFTPRGKVLFKTLKSQVHQLEQRYQHLL